MADLHFKKETSNFGIFFYYSIYSHIIALINTGQLNAVFRVFMKEKGHTYKYIAIHDLLKEKDLDAPILLSNTIRNKQTGE